MWVLLYRLGYAAAVRDGVCREALVGMSMGAMQGQHKQSARGEQPSLVLLLVAVACCAMLLQDGV